MLTSNRVVKFFEFQDNLLAQWRAKSVFDASYFQILLGLRSMQILKFQKSIWDRDNLLQIEVMNNFLHKNCFVLIELCFYTKFQKNDCPKMGLELFSLINKSNVTKHFLLRTEFRGDFNIHNMLFFIKNQKIYDFVNFLSSTWNIDMAGYYS